MAVFVWVGVGVAALCGVLPAVKLPRVLLVPLIAILGLAAWTLVSLAWTESAERTFAEFARIVGYLGVVILIWLGVGRSTWRLVAAGLLTAGVLVCFLTVLSRFWPAMFPSDTVAINLKTTRINYPFGYWNAVGSWSAMTITLCLAYAAHARSALVRGLALAAVPMCSVVLYMTLSRAGFGGVIIGATVLLVLAEWRWLTFVQTLLAAAGSLVVILALQGHRDLVEGTGSRGAWSMALVLTLVGGVLAAFAAVGGSKRFGQRLKMHPISGRRFSIAVVSVAVVATAVLVAAWGGSAYDEFTGGDASAIATNDDDRLLQLNGNRNNLWASAWRAFEANPVGGIGAGTFEFWWSRDGANGEFVRDVHNIYLEALSEQGVVGLVLLLMVFLGLLLAAWRARSLLLDRDRERGAVGVQAGLIAVFVGFMFQAGVDWMWESTAVAVFALVAIALASAASSERRDRPVGASRSVGLLVVSALAVITMFAGLSNARQIEKSQSAFREKDYAKSLEAADNAIRAESWSATAYAQRALALLKLGELVQAQAAIDLAEQKEPTNWRWPLITLQIAIEKGDAVGAVKARRRALKLRRFSKSLGERSLEVR